MPNWSQYDEDDYRLPEGMTRIGFDTDAQVYSYHDAQGKLYQGAPGNRYGIIRPVTHEPQYFADASYREAHKKHGDDSDSSPSPMTEFPDTWDPQRSREGTLPKLIAAPVRSLRRSLSLASRRLSQTAGQTEKPDASSPTPQAPIQPLKPARLRAQSAREYIVNGRDEKRNPPVYFGEGN